MLFLYCQQPYMLHQASASQVLNPWNPCPSAFKQWLLSLMGVVPQVLVDCVKANGTNGCNGGDPTAAYAYILDHGIPDETCSNYEVIALLTLGQAWHNHGFWY